MECACLWCRGAIDRSVRKSISSPTVLTGPRLEAAPFPKVALLPIGAGCVNARELVKANVVARTIVFSCMISLLLREKNLRLLQMFNSLRTNKITQVPPAKIGTKATYKACNASQLPNPLGWKQPRPRCPPRLGPFLLHSGPFTVAVFSRRLMALADVDLIVDRRPRGPSPTWNNVSSNWLPEGSTTRSMSDFDVVF
jgi:hypothetical protein